MKKIIIALFVLSTITSCHDEMLEFSCNPDVNEFVKSNILILSQMTLDEFTVMSIPQQRAAFRSYSPEKRLELWTEKLEKILYIESLTEQEEAHIEDLINYLSIENFIENEEGDPQNIENENFKIYWQDFALNILKWDKRRLAFIISSLYISEANYESSNSQSITSLEQVEDYPISDCVCNTSNDFCDTYPGDTCQNTGCNSSSIGCGLLWMEECNGQCI